MPNTTGPKKKFQLTNVETGKTSEMEALSPTLGPDVLNIASLHKDHGLFTFDPGFMSTASTESKNAASAIPLRER